MTRAAWTLYQIPALLRKAAANSCDRPAVSIEKRTRMGEIGQNLAGILRHEHFFLPRSSPFTNPTVSRP